MKRSILILALALAFSFTATQADAALTNIQKCNVFRAKTEMNFAKCLKIANLLEAKGKTADRAKCVTKYDDGTAKAKTKFVNDKMGVTEADCSLDQSSTDGAKALDIVSAGQELANFDLSTGTLPMLDDIQSLIDEAVGNVDITSDNQTVCEDANGTWENGTCAPSYNCSVGALCSAWAAEYPDQLQYYTNNYIGHTAASSGCPVPAWEAMQPDFDFPLIEFLTPPCST